MQPTSSAEMIEMMEDVASPLRRFIKDCCEAGPEFSVDLDVLYRGYYGWCSANEHHPMSKTKLRSQLYAAEPGVDVRRLGERGKQRWRCLGITLAERAEQEAGEKVLPLHPSAKP